jgi:hypothetical protein
MPTQCPTTLADLAAALHRFADRVERLPMASHRSPEEPFMARQELARDMRRTAAAALGGPAAAKPPAAVRSPARRRKPGGTHRIVVAGRIVLVQHRRAAFAL